MKVFVDTWGWLVLEDRRDPSHRAVRSLYGKLRRDRASFWTSDYVLDETITRLFQRRPFVEAKRFIDGILAADEQGYVRLERIDAGRFREAWALRLKFDDKPSLSFTDLTSFALMRERGITEVLTQDRHFHWAGFRPVP